MSVEQYPGKLTPFDISTYLGRRDPDVLLEIGCNDGTDTVSFIRNFPRCHVVAFEPDPRAIRKFKERVHGPCELVPVALSDELGTTTLFASAGEVGFHDLEWDKSSSICQPTRHLVRSPEITFPDDKAHRPSVVMLTLDVWWSAWIADHPEYPIIDFIWCDPQGAQAKIIRGGQKALSKTRWLYIEYYETALYEGEPNLMEMQAMLPDWELVATFEGENALFRNKAFDESH